MEFHVCDDCMQITQIKNDLVRRSAVISAENHSLHQSLLKAKDDMIKYITEMLKMKEGLVAERQQNLRLSMEREITQAMQPSMKFHLSSGLDEETGAKRIFIKPSSANKENDSEMVPLSSYSKLLNLMENQRLQYQSDLEVYQASNANNIDKLHKEVESMRSHATIMLAMYENTMKDLYKEKTENINLKLSVKQTMDAINEENKTNLLRLKAEVASEALKMANFWAKQNIDALHQQLKERDNLVSQLRQQQIASEELVKQQQMGCLTELNKYKKMADDLRNQLSTAQEKYAKLNHRRGLECEGFFADINIIRRELKRIKNNVSKSHHNCSVQEDVKGIESKVNDLHERLKPSYGRRL